MAFEPKSADELRQAFDGTHHGTVYGLAVMAGGGQGLETDDLARRLRRSLPEYLSSIAVDIQRNGLGR